MFSWFFVFFISHVKRFSFSLHCLRALLCNIEGDVDLCTFRMLILMWYFLHSERALKISPFQQQQLLNLNMGDYDETISPSMQEKLWMSKLCHLWTRIPTQYTKKMGFQDISPCWTNSALFILCQITTGSNFEVYIGKAVQPPELLGVGAIGNVGPNPKWPTICDNPITPHQMWLSESGSGRGFFVLKGSFSILTVGMCLLIGHCLILMFSLYYCRINVRWHWKIRS